MSSEAAEASGAEPDRLEGFSAPREVDRLFGHDAALAELDAALREGRLHHAWLLAGPEGIGKATLAYGFARTVLAAAHQGAGARSRSASLDDATFRKIASLSHPNLLVIRRSFNEKSKRYSQMIGVEEVRRLRAFLGNTAGAAGFRVVIVDRADELNPNAANALLKALEEPPAETLFLLISGAEGRLPVTIRSRCRTLRLNALTADELAGAVRAALARDEFEVEEDALSLALALAEGSVRRALELISGEGIAYYREILDLLGGLPELDGVRLQRLAEKLSPSGETERLDLFFSLLLGLLERLIRFAATGEGGTKEEQALARKLLKPAELAAWAELVDATRRAKDEALLLNLDRNLLVLESFLGLKQLAREGMR